jgi:tRNA-(ms[2]io[6]A)-hydroxylase
VSVESPAEFLHCPTPPAWIAAVGANLPTLLIDHANCERKAALTALGLIHRYPRQRNLVQRMSRLAREELRHFEQVLTLMADRGVDYQPLNASRYAKALLGALRINEPGRLTDALLIGALIEARSCERFQCLLQYPGLDAELVRFYGRLEQSERRHFQNYLALAEQTDAPGAVNARLAELAALEAQLISEPDDEFRFHSGPPRAG